MSLIHLNDEIRFNITDTEYQYQEIAERFHIDLSDDETFDKFKRLLKRCYQDEEIVLELLQDASDAGKVTELLSNASFIVFRGKTDREVLRQYLCYKAPYKSENEIDEYVNGISQEELSEYLMQLKDCYTTESHVYIVVFDYVE